MSSNRSTTSSSTGRRRTSLNQNRRPIHFSKIPIEQGIVCSLKENFGFIHCAERPAQLFFHYSELMNAHPDDIHIDTEVTFKAGVPYSSIEEKVAAFEVNVVPKGTVVWEMEDHPNRIFQGIVDRPVPTKMDKARHRSSMNTNEYDADGSIRVLLPDKNGDYISLEEQQKAAARGRRE